jgi:hypothetical protein
MNGRCVGFVESSEAALCSQLRLRSTGSELGASPTRSSDSAILAVPMSSVRCNLPSGASSWS